MKNKRRVIGNILLITGLLFLLGAGGLFFYNMVESNLQSEDSLLLTSKVKSFVSEAEATDPSENNGNLGYLMPDEQIELVPEIVDGSLFDGVLTMPSIDLEMAVYDTWNETYLRKSVCRYYGSPYTNDFVIAGHNYRSGFGKLKQLKVGDMIYFMDMKGNVIAYEVKLTEVIDGTDISGMLSGGWDLSLYTCTYGGEARYTVRCSRV